MHDPGTVVIRGGLVFDGHGNPPVRASVVVRDGTVVSLHPGHVDAGPDAHIIDAEGCWVTPGFIDMHTHYDAEIEVAPALSESLRHGVTSVVVGSCVVGAGIVAWLVTTHLVEPVPVRRQ